MICTVTVHQIVFQARKNIERERAITQINCLFIRSSSRNVARRDHIKASHNNDTWNGTETYRTRETLTDPMEWTRRRQNEKKICDIISWPSCVIAHFCATKKKNQTNTQPHIQMFEELSKVVIVCRNCMFLTSSDNAHLIIGD